VRSEKEHQEEGIKDTFQSKHKVSHRKLIVSIFIHIHAHKKSENVQNPKLKIEKVLTVTQPLEIPFILPTYTEVNTKSTCRSSSLLGIIQEMFSMTELYGLNSDDT
jgi:hypothetical protein